MSEVIDIHAHYFPEAYLKLIADEGHRFGAAYRSAPSGPVLHIGVMTTGTIVSKFIDLEERIAVMDAQGVGVHALSLTTPMVYWAEGELSLRLASAFNDAASAAHVEYPDRFVGLAQLPMLDTERAIAELERAAQLPGIRGVYMATNIAGVELSDRRFFPIYERIADRGLPIFLHPIEVIGHERLKKQFYLHNLLGNPFESAIAAAHLIFGGVLDAFPGLHVSLPHAGGALPILIGRLSHGFAVRAECRHLPRPPREYLARFSFDTISHSAEVLRYLIGLVGAERIMLGSDYCFDMGYERPVEMLTGIAGIEDAQRRAILGSNAARLLRIAT